MAGPPLPVPPGVSSSPFGWTGIRREKYTRWKGKLDGRDKIVRRMITESVMFNLKSAGVVILVVLAWLFSMLFPVLQAALLAVGTGAGTIPPGFRLRLSTRRTGQTNTTMVRMVMIIEISISDLENEIR